MANVNGCTANILLIHKSQEFGTLLQKFFGYYGHRVEISLSGTSGINRAKAPGVDLILLDMSMPSAEALGTASELASIPETENIPVIVLAENPELLCREHGRDLPDNCRLVLEKPIELGEIVEWISANLAKA